MTVIQNVIMLIRLTYLFTSILFSITCLSQNLVPNSSFEVLIDCPDNNSGTYLIESWNNPTSATPDIFNRCHEMGFDGDFTCPLDTGNYYLDPWQWAVPINTMGCQEPNSGEGYAGIILSWALPWREYLQVRMLEPLVSGQTYYVQIHISVADRSHLTCDAFHVSLSEDSLGSSTEYVLEISPDLENDPGNLFYNQNEWTQLNWVYESSGNEEYLTLGNFKIDGNFQSDSINPLKDHFPGTYVYVDDVYVGLENPVATEEYLNSQVKIVPNPSKDGLFTILSDFNFDGVVIVYNRLGEIVFRGDYISKTIDLSQLASGLYFLHLESKNQILKSRIMIN